jgi:hypothetical protein
MTLRILLVCFFGTMLSGCDHRVRATAKDCVELADRIVALELQEQGYRDPVLLERKQRAIRTALGAELRQCEGRPLGPGVLDCARGATTSEQLSHKCLR